MREQLRGWLHRLTSDEEQIEAESLTVGSKVSGAAAAGSCTAGDKVDLQGKLRSVQLQPSGDLATLIAELYDGTDAVDLVWLGRRSIVGIDAGRTVRVHGRIAIRDGHKAMYNPTYQLLSADA